MSTQLEVPPKECSDEGLRLIIQQQPQLTSLDVSFCRHITDAGLAPIATLTQLSELNLRGCKQITDAGLAHLAHMTQLKAIDLRYCGEITEQGKLLVSVMTANCADATTALAAGGDPNWVVDGTTLLHVAVRRNAIDVAQLLVENGARVNIKDSDEGQTPLHLAAVRNASAIARLLLDSGGVDAGVKDARGRTAVEVALASSSQGAAALLANVADSNGDAPLHKAVAAGDARLVAGLIAAGARVDVVGCGGGQTPLHLAVALLLLLLQGRDLVIEPLASVRWPAICFSTTEDVADARQIVELLLDAGADVNAPDSRGFTPLHLAVRKNADDMVRLLLERGANVNAKDGNGATPLHHAAFAGLSTVAALLMNRGADPEIMKKEMKTPIAIARERGDHNLLLASSDTTIAAALEEPFQAAQELRGHLKVLSSGVVSWLKAHLPALRIACDAHRSCACRQAAPPQHQHLAARRQPESALGASSGCDGAITDVPPLLVEWVTAAQRQVADWRRDAGEAVAVWQSMLAAEARSAHCSPRKRWTAISGVCAAQRRLQDLISDLHCSLLQPELNLSQARALSTCTAAPAAPTEQWMEASQPGAQSRAFPCSTEELQQTTAPRSSQEEEAAGALFAMRLVFPAQQRQVAEHGIKAWQERQVASTCSSLESAVPHRVLPQHAAALALPLFDPTAALTDFDGIEEMRTSASGVFTCTQGGQRRVLKRFDGLEKAQRECEGLGRIRSPFVVPLVKTLADGGSGKYFAVMPYYSGGHIDVWLRPRLLAADGSGAEALLRVMTEVAEGVAAIHDAGVVHCDLKWENLVMTSGGRSASPKIIDLSMCVTLGQRASKLLFTAAAATHPLVAGVTQGWAAPEIVDVVHKSHTEDELRCIVDFPIDVYALGLVLTRLLNDKGASAASLWTLPADDDTPREGVASSTLRRLAEVKAPLEALATAMLGRAPKLRPTAPQVARALAEMLAALKNDTKQPRQTMRPAITACTVCIGDTMPGNSVVCSAGHVVCRKCLPAACERWAAQPIAMHCAKGGALFCVHHDCGCTLPEQAVMQLSPAVLHPLLTRVAAQVAHFRANEELKNQRDLCDSLLERATRHVDEDILALRCPRCKAACVVDFEQCLAMTCPACGCNFCGYCGEDTIGDAHAHVGDAHRAGAPHHGPMFTTEAAWRKLWIARHQGRLDEYLQTLPDDVARMVCQRFGL